jgi:hypothetical protein
MAIRSLVVDILLAGESQAVGLGVSGVDDVLAELMMFQTFEGKTKTRLSK